jgi:hypothetical protein
MLIDAGSGGDGKFTIKGFGNLCYSWKANENEQDDKVVDCFHSYEDYFLDKTYHNFIKDK